jgi:glycerophosphoryl diester phosphodiesterase
MTIRGIAHRGFPTRFPENTISSFQAALDASFSHMELDVHLSKDGIPVVMHDPTINRMCNGTGRILHYTLEELKQFQVGQTETIPTLEEVFRLVKGRITVLVELKQTGNLYNGLEHEVLKVAQKLDMVDQLIATSFDYLALAKMRELSPHIQIGLLMNSASSFVFAFMKEIGAHYMSIPISSLTEEYDRLSQENNVQLIVRPIDTEDAMNTMLKFPSVLASTNTMEQWKQFYEINKSVLQQKK